MSLTPKALGSLTRLVLPLYRSRSELRGHGKVNVSLFQLCNQLIDRKQKILSVGMRRAQDKFL